MSSVDLTNFLPVLGTLLGTGGVGVVFVMWLVKKLSNVKSKVSEAEADHILHTITVALSVLTAVAQYVIQLKGRVPVDFLGISSVTVYGASQFVFKESRTIDKFLTAHYGQVESVLTDPAKAAVDAVDKVESDPKAVMSGVETVAKDAKVLEGEFAV